MHAYLNGVLEYPLRIPAVQSWGGSSPAQLVLSAVSSALTCRMRLQRRQRSPPRRFCMATGSGAFVGGLALFTSSRPSGTFFSFEPLHISASNCAQYLARLWRCGSGLLLPLLGTFAAVRASAPTCLRPAMAPLRVAVTMMPHTVGREN